MEKKKKIRKQNGITITTMVIAVILLIILAAISITSLRDSDKDILETAYDAKTGMEVSTYQEELDIIDVQCASEQLSNGLSASDYIDLFEESVEASSTFETATIERKSTSALRIETEEGYVFTITQSGGVNYSGIYGSEDFSETYTITEDDVIFTYSPSDWTNSTVTVSIALAFDDDATFQYSYDKETWTDYTEPLEITENMKIYVMYEAENYDDTYVTGEVTNIDTIEPLAFTSKVKDVTTNTITVTGETEDAEATSTSGQSGIDHYEFGINTEESYADITWYDLDDSPDYDKDSDEIVFTFDNLTQTTDYYAYIKAVDAAGNEQYSCVTATTRTVPGGNDIVEDENENEITVITFEYSDNYSDDEDIVWTTEDVLVTINVNGDVADDVSDGTYKVQYSTDSDSTWRTYTGTLTIEENDTVYARLYDGNNGGEAAETTISCIDKDAPTTPTLSLDEYDDTSLTVSASSEDDVSGIATYYFYIREYNASADEDSSSDDDSEELSLADTITGYTITEDYITFTGLTAETSYIIRVVVTDNAGNTSEKSAKMKVSTGDIADLYYVYNQYGWGLGDAVYYPIDLDGDEADVDEDERSYSDDWEIYYLADAVYDEDGNVTGITAYTDTDGNVSSTVTADNLPDYVFIIAKEYINHTKSSDTDTYYVISDALKQNMLLYDASLSYDTAYATESYLFSSTSSNATNYPDYTLVVSTPKTYGFTWFSSGTSGYPYYYITTTTDDDGNSTTTGSYSSTWANTSISIDTSTLKYFMNNWLIDNYSNGSTSNNVNEKLSAILSNTNYWTELVNSTYASYAVGASSLEMFVASWNQAGYETLYLSPSSSDEDGYSANGYEIGFSEDGLRKLNLYKLCSNRKFRI